MLALICALAVPAMAADSDFAIEDGVLTGYTGPGGDIVIPSGVTEIASYAFSGNDKLTSVVIPDGVTEIRGNLAFGGAFARVLCLTAVAIPKSVTDIGVFAFEDCGIKDVYCAGTEAEWDQLKEKAGWSNDPLISANIHFNSTMPAPRTVGGFSDVYDTDYYSDAVVWAANHDPLITNGIGGGKFDLNSTLSYDQMLTFMARAAGADASGANWSQKAMTWADDNGLTEGLNVTANGACPRCGVVYCLWKQMA